MMMMTSSWTSTSLSLERRSSANIEDNFGDYHDDDKEDNDYTVVENNDDKDDHGKYKWCYWRQYNCNRRCWTSVLAVATEWSLRQSRARSLSPTLKTFFIFFYDCHCWYRVILFCCSSPKMTYYWTVKLGLCQMNLGLFSPLSFLGRENYPVLYTVHCTVHCVQ